MKNKLLLTDVQTRRDGRQGSALVTSIVFTTIIMFGLAGLLPMLVSDWKMSARVSLQEAAFSLAEAAIEEAIWAVNEYGSNDGEWTTNGWALDQNNGAYWYKEWKLSEITESLGQDFNLDEGRIGVYRAIVQRVSGSIVNIAAQGEVSGGANVKSDVTAKRYIETEFRRPNPAGYGLIARDSLNFNGKPEFDRYDSRVFPFVYAYGINSITHSDYTALIAAATSDSEKEQIARDYSFYVGSISSLLNSLGLGNSIIDGTLATGATNDGISDPTGGATVNGGVEWEFIMDFPPVVKPSTTGWDTSIY